MLHRLPPGAKIAAGLAALALLGAGGGLLLVRRSETPTPAQLEAQARDQAELLDAARIAVRDRFADADSVTFDRLMIPAGWPDPAVCGYADIEEPDDSFEGPERFVYVNDGMMIESIDGSAAVADRWKGICDGQRD